MAGFMRNYSGETYALLRIVAGFLFIWHGSQKILGFPPYPTPEAAAQAAQAPAFIIWTAGLIELIGGLLVMVGLFTRWAAFLCSGLMAAAYWMAHGFQAPLPAALTTASTFPTFWYIALIEATSRMSTFTAVWLRLAS